MCMPVQMTPKLPQVLILGVTSKLSGVGKFANTESVHNKESAVPGVELLGPLGILQGAS